MAGKMFVNCIVYNLPNAVVQSRAVMGVPEVHPRPLSYCLQPFQDLDTTSVVVISHILTPGSLRVPKGNPQLVCHTLGAGGYSTLLMDLRKNPDYGH